MTLAGKEAIASLFNPPLHPRDIFGREDLEALLARHEQVERRHFRLWISDTITLTSALNKRELGLKRHVIESISREAPLLVKTRHFHAAEQILKEEGSVIIAGPPGVGKTSTAHLLIADLIEKGWELIVASDRIDDAERLRDPHAKQVVYYDDFLGASLHTAFLDGKNEDARLLALLETASEDQNLKVVLTTREYVLAAARQSHPRLLQSRFDISRLLIDATELDAYERAEMAYRRIYHSPYRFILDQPTSVDDWLPIIGHRDFNPRLMRLYMEACARMLPAKMEAQSIRDFIIGFVEALDDPSELWRTIYDDHLTDAQRYLLQTLVTMPSSVVVEDLIVLTASWACSSTFSPTETQWRAEIRILDGDFISTYTDRKGQTASNFANASISSYVSYRLAMELETVLRILDHAVLFEQVEIIFRLIAGRLPPRETDSGSFDIEDWLEDYEREIVGHTRLWSINEEEHERLQTAIRDAVVRTLGVGHYSNHPSFGNTPKRWMKTHVYMVDRLEIVLAVVEALDLADDSDLAHRLADACKSNLDYSTNDPVRLVKVFETLQRKAPLTWVDAIGNLIESAEPLLFRHLKEGSDFIAAIRYLNLIGRPNESMLLGDKLRNAARNYSPSEQVCFWSEIDLRYFINDFDEAASMIGLDIIEDLSELRTRIEARMRAIQPPSFQNLPTPRQEPAPKHVVVGDLSLSALRKAASILVPGVSSKTKEGDAESPD
ncbi:hypothetical protein GCM10009678_63170 [Actinomadura kijaniata]